MEAVNLTFTTSPMMEHFEAGDPEVAAKNFERNHVSLIERAYAAIGHGDAAAFQSLLAPDAVLTIDGFLNMDGRWEGAAQVMAAVERNFARVEAQRVGIERICAQGDQVAIYFQETGRYRSTGQSYEARAVQWFRLAEGKIVELHEIAATKMLDGGKAL